MNLAQNLVLPVDKPIGPTSFQVVRQVKHALGAFKVGHAGSLDPFATGVLVLLIGRATKLSYALLNADKKYRAKALFGQSTDTMDSTGALVEQLPVPGISSADIGTALKDFEGEWLQTPPMYSAKKVKGVRLYELARKNISIRRDVVPVQLYAVELISWVPPVLEFELHCSKGTYVRSLADELARKLGSVAHLIELRRLACGPFTIDDTVTLDQVEQTPSSVRAVGALGLRRLLQSEQTMRRGDVRLDNRLPSSSLALGLDGARTNLDSIANTK